MITRSQLLVSGAQVFAAVGELSAHDRQSVFGDWVKPSDDGTWDTQFICHIGNRSQFDWRTNRSDWPLPPVANADELFHAAWDRGMLREEPEPGDIFTAWSPAKKRYVRCGVIVLVESTWVDELEGLHHQCVTIEANLNERADARGPFVSWVRRVLSIEHGDSFIRWADALESVEEIAA